MKYWLWYLKSKWINRRLSGWHFSFGPISVWKEARYYRSTGYFLSVGEDNNEVKILNYPNVLYLKKIFGKRIPVGFEWKFKSFEPSAIDNLLLDAENNAVLSSLEKRPNETR